MLGDESELDVATISDGLGELANLLAGGVKKRMHDQDIDLILGLPSVITGENFHLSFDLAATLHPFQFIVDGAHMVDGLFLLTNRADVTREASTSKAGEAK